MIHLSHPHQGCQGMSLHVIKQCLLENLAEMIIIPICLLQNEKICVRFMKIYGQSWVTRGQVYCEVTPTWWWIKRWARVLSFISFCISEYPALKVEVWTKETPSFMPIKAQRPHPSHFWARILCIKGFREIHPSHHPSHDPSLTPHINPPVCQSFVSVSASGCISLIWGMMWEICEGFVRDKKHPSHSFSPLYKGFSED